MKLYAHSTDGPESTWEALGVHLERVGDRAGEFSRKFGAAEFGRAAGLLHDLGKAKPEWQRYLRKLRPTIPHASEGALAAVTHYAALHSPSRAAVGRLIAFAIAGHHAGLANGVATGGGLTPLDDRLSEAERLPPIGKLPPLGAAPDVVRSAGKDPFAWAFFTRMLFSALVDADRLATERFMRGSGQDASDPRAPSAALTDLKSALDAKLAAKFGSRDPADELATLRAQVLADCRSAARWEPGLFSLTVPTGGGKTLSSLAFALDHAAHHAGRFDRVIYVIPFTSIIDQTADVFRDVIGDADAILEHHSAFDDAKLDHWLAREDDYGRERLRLATQNWARPVVITTAVQFFESLFANTPKSCRKLHNIARSVIVLDEVQTLPVKLLRPCVAALKELARGYGCSVVLCTATQPALTKEVFRKASPAHPPREMLEAARVREIVKPSRDLYGRLRRVRAEVAGTISDDALVQALGERQSGLVIVNNRRHARELFDAAGKAGLSGLRHLTTAMTAAHRQQALGEIRAALQAAQPIRLVSTSLIEAGVDISFAAVWRASAGLDQIVQAAGRCNRNGELGPLGGRLVIFEPEAMEGRKTPPELEQNAAAASSVLAKGLEPLSPEAVEAYFAELLWRKDDDGHWQALDAQKVGASGRRGIMRAIEEDAPRLNFAFADIAAAFRMIETAMVPVIIPASINPVAGVDDDVLARIPRAGHIGGIMRELQRHIVQVPRRARDALIKAGSAAPIAPDKYAEQFVRLTNDSLYSPDTGLNWDDPTYRDVLMI